MSFSFRGNNPVREAIHAVFLFHAIEAGLDMGIVNAGALVLYDDVEPELRERITDVVLNRRPDAAERLLEIAEAHNRSGEVVEAEAEQWRSLPVAERITHSLVKGLDAHVEADTEELRAGDRRPRGPPDRGDRGSADVRAWTSSGTSSAPGRMFLPQVVKSARVMKKAVGYLIPFIEQEKLDNPELATAKETNGTIVMATVKGDVHDIGKNIVGVVLQCNNFEVIDLGVMVPVQKILDTAREVGRGRDRAVRADHPVAGRDGHGGHRDAAARAELPLLIGGATTSRAHTAVKVDPRYDGPVVWVKDASRSVPTVASLLHPERRRHAARRRGRGLHGLRTRHAAKSERPLVTLAAGPRRRPRAGLGGLHPARTGHPGGARAARLRPRRAPRLHRLVAVLRGLGDPRPLPRRAAQPQHVRGRPTALRRRPGDARPDRRRALADRARGVRPAPGGRGGRRRARAHRGP